MRAAYEKQRWAAGSGAQLHYLGRTRRLRQMARAVPEHERKAFLENLKPEVSTHPLTCLSPCVLCCGTGMDTNISL